MDANKHPDHQRQQGGRPHPLEHLVHPGAEHHQEKTTYSHEECRNRGPSLWLIGEPRREYGQQRPAQRESAQDRADNLAVTCRDERSGDEQQSGHESDGQ